MTEEVQDLIHRLESQRDSYLHVAKVVGDAYPIVSDAMTSTAAGVDSAIEIVQEWAHE